MALTIPFLSSKQQRPAVCSEQFFTPQSSRRSYDESESLNTVLRSPSRRLPKPATSPEGIPYVTEFPPLLVLPRWWVLVASLLATAVVAWACTCGEDLLAEYGLTQGSLLMYVSIPVVSTLFTYGHIWAALYMTFYPMEFRGWCQIEGTNVGLGWQGIVPSKAEKMARTSVNLMTSKLLSVTDIFSRIDPDMIAKELDPILQTTLANIINKVAMEEHPLVWSSIHESVKREIVASAREEAPHAIRVMMDDVKNNIHKVFDLTSMVVNALTRDPGLQNYMFIECGYDELMFIRDFGAWMGFSFGVFQMGLWVFFQAGWMLPTFGLAVGMVSNWIALKMIFEPIEPYSLFGGRIVIQGRFLKRQREVSQVYAHVVTTKMLSARNIVPAIVSGPCSDALFELIHQHVRAAIDSNLANQKALSLVRVVKGTERFEACKKMVADGLVESLPETMSHVEKYMDTAMDVENILKAKMTDMHPKDFERLLHPVFEEDEWKLVLMGGVLGVFVGCTQWYVLGS